MKNSAIAQKIPHFFLCPDCGNKFSMDVDASDLEEIKPKEVKDGITWAAYLCPNCS